MLRMVLKGCAVSALAVGVLSAASSRASAVSPASRARLDGCTTICAISGCSVNNDWWKL